MGKIKNYAGQQAIQYLPDFLATSNSIVISPVKDIIHTNHDLGHLIVLPGQQICFEGEKVTGQPLSSAQLSHGFKGSFMLIGTNPNFFNHLFNNKITGKYLDKMILVDQQFKGLVSYELNQIIKQHIVGRI